MLDKKSAARPNMDELLTQLEAISSTGLQDGPAELRPSESHVVSSDQMGVTSGVIRAQIDERVRATDKLALVSVPSPAQQTTGMRSLGEQVAVSRYSRLGMGALIGAGVLLLGAGGGFFLLKRSPPVAPIVAPPSRPSPIGRHPRVRPRARIPRTGPPSPPARMPARMPARVAPASPAIATSRARSRRTAPRRTRTRSRSTCGSSARLR
jgi:hypothetical protein